MDFENMWITFNRNESMNTDGVLVHVLPRLFLRMI